MVVDVALTIAGLNCSVFMMPILPYLTDTRHHLERALQQLSDAGATSVMYSALHLRQGARQWLMQWLERAPIDRATMLPRSPADVSLIA